MKKIDMGKSTLKLDQVELKLIENHEAFELLTRRRSNIIYRYAPLDVVLPVHKFGNDYHLLFNPKYDKAVEAVNKVKEITKY